MEMGIVVIACVSLVGVVAFVWNMFLVCSVVAWKV